MNEKFLKELSESIVSVHDANNIEILYKEAELKPHLFKYSSTHKEKVTLFLDGIPHSSKEKLKITYKCSCGAINTILLEKFVLKQKLSCVKCSQTEELKKWHGEVIRNIHNGVGYVSKDKKKIKRQYNFESETEEFKQEFYKTNLTEEEYNVAIKYIHSIHGIEIKDKNVVFLEHDNGVNAKKYRQMVLLNGNKYSFKEIQLKCPLCNSVFSISRPIKERVLAYNFDCRQCYLSNKVFQVKKYKKCLTYQGNLELDFIKRCERENIEITNGAVIDYTFNNKKLKYTIDFYLPQYRIQVEIKDNHIWHRKQVESGQWDKKENAAKDFCTNNNMSYALLFPKNVDSFFENLLKR